MLVLLADAFASAQTRKCTHGQNARVGKLRTPNVEKRGISPEFTQLETFRTFGENGTEIALIVTEIAGAEEGCFSLSVAVDLAKKVATMAFQDEPGDEITGIAVNPEMDRFFQSTLKGCLDSRKLSTGEYVKSVEPIPNIMLVNADFRGAQFGTETLREMV